jgi:predicted outer membrane repeat protein
MHAIRAREMALRTETMPHTVSTTTLTVTSTVDSPLATTASTCLDQETPTPKCSLRAAVQLADKLGTSVKIVLRAGTYQLTDTGLRSLVVENPGGTTIVGAGPTSTTIDVPSGAGYGVIQLTDSSTTSGGSTLWLSDLAIEGGQATDGGGLQMVNADDSAVLNDVTVSGNSASTEGGGIACGTSDDGGSLWINSSSITDNTSSSNGGGLYSYWCNVHLYQDSLDGNTASGGDGGGLFVDYGSLSTTGGAILGNSATDGGGIYNEYGLSQLNGSNIKHNVATNGAGGGDYEYWSQLVMTGGSITGNSATGSDGAGGGLATDETANVVLDHVGVTGNSASSTSDEYAGGGIYLYAGEDYGATQLTIEDNSSVSDNTGGGIDSYLGYGGGEVDIADSTLSGNTSSVTDCGAAICNVSYQYGGFNYSLTNDTIDSNHQTGTGTISAGAVLMWQYEYGSAELHMSNVTLEHNSSTANDAAGAVDLYAEYGSDASAQISDCTIKDNTATGSYGTGGVEAYSRTYSNNTVSISGSDISGNSAPAEGDGGGISAYNGDDYNGLQINLNKDAITGNSVGSTSATGNGGGIWIDYYATLNLTNSTVTGNAAIGTSSSGADGGGIYDASEQTSRLVGDTISGNRATGLGSLGGGMYSYDSYGGDLISSTTIASNTAQEGAGYYGYETYDLALVGSTVSGNVAGGTTSQPGEGGGFYLEEASLDSLNSTIADNVANPGGAKGYGGGIYSYEDAAATLSYTTISGNVASVGAGYYGDGTTGYTSSGALNSSILSGNTTTVGGSTAANCAYATAGEDLNSVGDNVIGSGCVTAVMPSDAVTKTPGLNALAANGGPTKTMALKATSPAVNLSSGPCPATDQRGQARPGTKCDSGAYQVALGIVTSVGPSSGRAGTSVTIHGSNFSFAKKVTFGSKMATFVIKSPTVIIAKAPAGLSGKVAVKVATPDGAGRAGYFTYPKSSTRR